MQDSRFYESLYNSSNPIRRWLHVTRRQLIWTYIDKAAAARPSLTAIEVGFGDGSYLEQLLKYTPHVTGFDYDRGLIASAKNKFNNRLTLIHGDVRNYKIDQKYDLVLCTEMLEHIVEPRDALINMATWLRPGGHLVFSTPNKYSILEVCARLIRFKFVSKIVSLFYAEAVHDLEHVGLKTESELRGYFTDAGFEVLESENLGFYLPLISEFFPCRGTVSLFIKLEKFFQRTFLCKLLWTQAYLMRKKS